MTIPFRPAPPPPTSANIQNNFQTNNNNHNTAVAHQQQQLLQSTTSESQVGRKKNPPPPRPPPPKLGHKSRRREQSVNIFSNLFGTAGRSAAIKSTIGHQRTAEFSNSHKTELPFHSSATCHNNGASIELISFDSPPSSPQFTQKFGDNERTSSANSFESNKSISYYSNSSGFSSASGGGSGSAISSLNNGFEDDFFSLANGRTSSSSTATTSQAVDPYEFIYSNDFPTPSSSSTFYTATDSTINRKKFPVEFNDSLCNGKSLLAPEPALAMPTIIRPAATKPKSLNKQSAAMVVPLFPKSMSVVGKQATQTNDRDVEASYGIALFDFDAGQMGDLSLKVYLLYVLVYDQNIFTVFSIFSKTTKFICLNAWTMNGIMEKISVAVKEYFRYHILAL